MPFKINKSTKKKFFRSSSSNETKNLIFNSVSISPDQAIENIYGPNVLITENEIPLALELTNEVIAYA